MYQLGVSIFIRLNQDFFNGKVSKAIIFPITLSLATPKLSEESYRKDMLMGAETATAIHRSRISFRRGGKLCDFTEETQKGSLRMKENPSKMPSIHTESSRRSSENIYIIYTWVQSIWTFMDGLQPMARLWLLNSEWNFCYKILSCTSSR